jgi:hypothetical protein
VEDDRGAMEEDGTRPTGPADGLADRRPQDEQPPVAEPIVALGPSGAAILLAALALLTG